MCSIRDKKKRKKETRYRNFGSASRWTFPKRGDWLIFDDDPSIELNNKYIYMYVYICGIKKKIGTKRNAGLTIPLYTYDEWA